MIVACDTSIELTYLDYIEHTDVIREKQRVSIESFTDLLHSVARFLLSYPLEISVLRKYKTRPTSRPIFAVSTVLNATGFMAF